MIVPLAGPDFVRANGSIKALIPYHGQPLLKHALDSRPWASKGMRYSFILHDCEEARQFSRDFLWRWYKECSIVYLSVYSRGAAISALAGLSSLDNFRQPLIIDLADIIYKADINVEKSFQNAPALGGIALAFESCNPKYSYLAIDGNGRVLEAAEKKVISSQASAGTYLFRSSSVFLKALAHAIENECSQTYNNLFYVCPLFNGVIAQGMQVMLANAGDIYDLKTVDSP